MWVKSGQKYDEKDFVWWAVCHVLLTNDLSTSCQPTYNVDVDEGRDSQWWRQTTPQRCDAFITSNLNKRVLYKQPTSKLLVSDNCHHPQVLACWKIFFVLENYLTKIQNFVHKIPLFGAIWEPKKIKILSIQNLLCQNLQLSVLENCNFLPRPLQLHRLTISAHVTYSTCVWYLRVKES